MVRLSMSSAIKEASSRNAAATAAYRDCARRLPPGPVSKLAASIAQLRAELGKTLAALAGDRAALESEVELEAALDPFSGLDSPGGSPLELKTLLKRMAEAEAADFELLAALAGAVLPASGEAAERLAAEAAAARKRSAWAQDHLDLIDMSC